MKTLERPEAHHLSSGRPARPARTVPGPSRTVTVQTPPPPSPQRRRRGISESATVRAVPAVPAVRAVPAVPAVQTPRFQASRPPQIKQFPGPPDVKTVSIQVV